LTRLAQPTYDHFTVDGTLIEAMASLKSFGARTKSRRTASRRTIRAIRL
jgi:hypothetical protein